MLTGWLNSRFELARGGGGHNLPPMEGLRGLAVLLVFLVHYVSLLNPLIQGHDALHAIADVLHSVGNAGVDLFFVLSGYLIYGTVISRTTHFLPFIWRRLQRIYPAFLVMFAIYVAISLSLAQQSRIPPGAFNAAIYIGANLLLLPGLFPIEALITVAWSLSYEMAYYLAIPNLVTACGLRGWRHASRMALFGALAAGFALVCGQFGGPVRLLMFVAGILLFEAIDEGPSRVPTPSSLIGLLGLVGGLFIVWVPPNWLPATGTGGPALKITILFGCFFVLCLACFREPRSMLGGAMSWTPLRWLGNMSYSYYLVHGLALKVAYLPLLGSLVAGSAGAWMFWGLLPIFFVITLAAAALLFLAVERPLSLAAGTRSRFVDQPASLLHRP